MMKNLTVFTSIAIGAALLASAPAQANQPPSGISNATQVSFSNLPKTNDNQLFVVGSRFAKEKVGKRSIRTKPQSLRSKFGVRDSRKLRSKRSDLKGNGAFHPSLYFESHSGGGA